MGAVESLPAVRIVNILVDADEQELVFGKELRELPHRRKSANARRTPGRPEIEQHNASAQRLRRQRMPPAVDRSELRGTGPRSERKIFLRLGVLGSSLNEISEGGVTFLWF